MDEESPFSLIKNQKLRMPTFLKKGSLHKDIPTLISGIKYFKKIEQNKNIYIPKDKF
jgi:hypothetical protein